MNQQSLEQIIQSSDYSLKIPTTKIFGLEVSTETLVITLLTDSIFAALWVTLGLFDISTAAPWIFSLYMLLDVYNILNDSITTDISVQEAYNDIQNEVIRVEGLIGVIIILYGVAALATEIDATRRSKAMEILTYSLVLMALSLVTYSTPNNSPYLRNLRIIKERLSNHSIFLFILALVVMLFG